MFIDAQLDLITAPEEPNVVAVINMALRWSGIPVEAGAINIWPRRGHPTKTTHHYLSTKQLKDTEIEALFGYYLDSESP